MEYKTAELVLYEGEQQLEYIKLLMISTISQMTLKDLEELKEKGFIKVEEKMWTTPGGNILPRTEYTFKI